VVGGDGTLPNNQGCRKSSLRDVVESRRYETLDGAGADVYRHIIGDRDRGHGRFLGLVDKQASCDVVAPHGVADISAILSVASWAGWVGSGRMGLARQHE
jgi:hypothetical protein